jgi:hypothetical protein
MKTPKSVPNDKADFEADIFSSIKHVNFELIHKYRNYQIIELQKKVLDKVKKKFTKI